MAYLNLPTFCIVTGASRGIGKEIAIQLAQRFGPQSSLVLIARNEKGLRETAQTIEEKVSQNVDVKCISADLSDKKDITRLCTSTFDKIGNIARLSRAMLIHNAAGHFNIITKYARDLHDVSAVQKYCLMHLSGPIALTSAFFKVFGHDKDSIPKTVVHVTSKAATLPLKTLHMYSMSKAGLDMFFRVMALEEPDSRFLSFDPGVVDTHLFRESLKSIDPGVVSFTENTAKQPYFLKPEQSASALVKALTDGQYVNGGTVRAYDILEMDI